MTFYTSKLLVEADGVNCPDADEESYRQWRSDWMGDHEVGILPDFFHPGDIIVYEPRKKMLGTIPGVSALVLTTPVRFKNTGSLLEPYSWRFEVLDMQDCALRFAEFYEDDIPDHVIRNGEVVWQFDVDKE